MTVVRQQYFDSDINLGKLRKSGVKHINPLQLCHDKFMGMLEEESEQPLKLLCVA